ncbi:MAG: hypothetical protein LBU29_02500 [Endomicrobium sp.]|nr:hypothetical protein [Endomicrobium sp.]
MKRVITVLALVCSMLLPVAIADTRQTKCKYKDICTEIIPMIGVQPDITMSAFGKDLNTNAGFAVGLECFRYINEYFALGFGGSYSLPRKFREKEDSPGTISFMPFYVSAKLCTTVGKFENTYMFLSPRVGYITPIMRDSNFKSTKGGLCYGLSLGVCIDYLVFQVTYLVSEFTYKKSSLDNADRSKCRCSAIAFSVGFRFY